MFVLPNVNLRHPVRVLTFREVGVGGEPIDDQVQMWFDADHGWACSTSTNRSAAVRCA